MDTERRPLSLLIHVIKILMVISSRSCGRPISTRIRTRYLQITILLFLQRILSKIISLQELEQLLSFRLRYRRNVVVEDLRYLVGGIHLVYRNLIR